ncbi:hypothetical protein POTOM_005116 [Populus tomentosa]|uniref:Uncharacterized protein n=1 Tax=Populus tomentosa TaxID=118781 RepID=A0A8X8ALW9_POPTO|nr:hypothetical protein POTOM_005116 [Populus tomentosa]
MASSLSLLDNAWEKSNIRKTFSIYVKRGWHQRYMSTFWSFKSTDASSNRKSRISPPQRGNRTWKKADMKKFHGCSWSSFASCASNPNAPIQRLKSFS